MRNLGSDAHRGDGAKYHLETNEDNLDRERRKVECSRGNVVSQALESDLGNDPHERGSSEGFPQLNGDQR